MRKTLAKFILLSLIMLLSAGMANAKIVITPAYEEVYKIGDIIPLTGYYEGESTGLGNLRIDLRCDASPTPFTLYWKSIDSKKGQQLQFSELGIGPFKTIKPYEGNCYLEATTSFGDNAKSSTFAISSALTGTFTLDKQQIKLGETLYLAGDIKDANSNPVTTKALFFMRGESLNMLIGEQTIENGKLEMHYTPLQMESGTYRIIAVFEDMPAQNELDTGLDVEIIALIDADIVLNKESYKPGDTFTVNVMPKDNPEAKARFLFFNEEETKEQKDGMIAYTAKVPMDARVGKNAMNVILYDRYGNMAYFTRPFNVEQTATRIDLEHTFSPEDFALRLKATAYDQTGKKIVTELSLKIVDSERNKVLETTILPDIEKTVNVPLDLRAGQYSVVVYRDSASTERTFTIEKNEKVLFSSGEDTILADNLGNAPYSSPITVTATDLKGKATTFTHQLDVEPDSQAIIPLSDYLKEGVYEAEIAYTENGEIKTELLSEVSVMNGKSALSSITGNAILDTKPLKVLFYVVLFVIIMAVIAIAVYHYFDGKKGSKEQKVVMKAHNPPAEEDTVDLSKYHIVPVKRDGSEDPNMKLP